MKKRLVCGYTGIIFLCVGNAFGFEYNGSVGVDSVLQNDSQVLKITIQDDAAKALYEKLEVDATSIENKNRDQVKIAKGIECTKSLGPEFAAVMPNYSCRIVVDSKGI